MAFIARFSFDVPFGRKPDLFKVMKKWEAVEADIGFPKPQVLVGSIGAPESRLEMNYRFDSLEALEKTWAKVNDPPPRGRDHEGDGRLRRPGQPPLGDLPDPGLNRRRV